MQGHPHLAEASNGVHRLQVVTRGRVTERVPEGGDGSGEVGRLETSVERSHQIRPVHVIDLPRHRPRTGVRRAGIDGGAHELRRHPSHAGPAGGPEVEELLAGGLAPGRRPLDRARGLNGRW